jgi:hypothetical protein
VTAPADPAGDPDEPADDHDDRGRTGPRLATVTPIRRESRRPAPEPVHDPTVDEIALLLAAPSGAHVPDLPRVEPIVHQLAHRELAEVLDDALDHLEIDWS